MASRTPWCYRCTKSPQFVLLVSRLVVSLAQRSVRFEPLILIEPDFKISSCTFRGVPDGTVSVLWWRHESTGVATLRHIGRSNRADRQMSYAVTPKRELLPEMRKYSASSCRDRNQRRSKHHLAQLIANFNNPFLAYSKRNYFGESDLISTLAEGLACDTLTPKTHHVSRSMGRDDNRRSETARDKGTVTKYPRLSAYTAGVPDLKNTVLGLVPFQFGGWSPSLVLGSAPCSVEPDDRQGLEEEGRRRMR